MTYAFNEGYVGLPEAGDIFIPDTTQRCPLGQMVTGIDPFFGFVEAIYAQATAAHGVGRCVTLDQLFTTTDIANAAGTNRPFYVAIASMGIGTFGWYATGGQRPISVTATVAANAVIGATGAGQLGPGTTTKYAVGINVLQPSTYAPTKLNCTTQNGSKRVFVPSVDGLFVGLPVSGTGVQGGSTIAGIDPSQNMITLSATANATGSATLTFTWTGFVLALLNRPFLPLMA